MLEQEKSFEEEGRVIEIGPNPAIVAVSELIRELKALKTEERSETNRYLAIAITDAEKLAAFMLCYFD